VAPRCLQRVDNVVGGVAALRVGTDPPGGGARFMISESHAKDRKTRNRSPTPSWGLRTLCGYRVGGVATGAQHRTSGCQSATDAAGVDPRSCDRVCLHGSQRRCHTGGATPPSRRCPELETLALGSSCSPRRHAAAQTLISWRLSPPQPVFLASVRALQWRCGGGVALGVRSREAGRCSVPNCRPRRSFHPRRPSGWCRSAGGGGSESRRDGKGDDGAQGTRR